MEKRFLRGRAFRSLLPASQLPLRYSRTSQTPGSYPGAELLPALPVSQLPDDPQEGWSPHNPGLSDRQKAEPLPHAPLPL